MTIQTLVYFIVALVVALQLWAFFATQVKIRHFKKLIPSENTRVHQLYVEREIFEKKSTTDILEEWKNYILPTRMIDMRQLPIVCSMTGEPDLENLKVSPGLSREQMGEVVADRLGIRLSKTHIHLSSYLISSMEQKPDFSIMKDVVERHTDAMEHEIQIQLPLPLFLGLIGTFAGIVAGLFGMGSLDFNSDTLSSEPINTLLSGVKIAMIASGMGLLLTLINNALFFRPAKTIVEKRKSAMLNYLATIVLPQLTKAAQSSDQKSQIAAHTGAVKELDKHIKQLQPAIEGTRGIVDKLLDATQSQAKMLDQVKALNLPGIAKNNLEFFREVTGHLDQLEKLNAYLQNVNGFLTNSTTLNTTLLDVLQRTNGVEAIAKDIGETVNGNRKFQEYVHSHFKDLETRGNMMRGAVGKVDEVIATSLEELKDSVRVQTQSYRSYANEQIEALRDEMKVERGTFNQLAHLEGMKKQLEEINGKTASQQQALLGAIQTLNNSMASFNESVKHIESQKGRRRWGWLSGRNK